MGKGGWTRTRTRVRSIQLFIHRTGEMREHQGCGFDESGYIDLL